MRLFVTGLTMALAAMPLAAQNPPAIENDQVRVLVVTDAPGHKSAMHEHARNRVMIYLDAGTDRIAWENGRVEDVKFRPGEIRWSPAGGRHTSENISGRPFRIVEIELKNAGAAFTPPALDPLKVAPKLYRVALDNAQARVIVARVAPKQKVPLHEHTRNRVVVYLTDQRNRVTDDAGQAVETSAKAGDVRWSGPAKHSEENVGDRPIEAVLVELK